MRPGVSFILADFFMSTSNLCPPETNLGNEIARPFPDGFFSENILPTPKGIYEEGAAGTASHRTSPLP